MSGGINGFGGTMKSLLIASALLLIPSFAQAQSGADRTNMTLSTSASPLTAGGRMFGCTLVFTVVAQDFAYRDGGLVSIDGSMSASLTKLPNGMPSLRTSLKMLPSDAVDDNGAIAKEPFIPESIWYLDAEGLPNSASIMSSIESGGGRFAIFQFDEAWASIQEKVNAEKSLVVAYNRQPGGLDVHVPIDLTVIKDDGESVQRGDKTIKDWAACNLKLLNQFRAFDEAYQRGK